MPLLPFAPQCFLRDGFSLGNPADERLRLMGIEVVHKDVPPGCSWIAANEALQMSEAVFLIARWPKRRFDHLPCDDIEIEKPRERAVPNIFEFTPEHTARRHRQVGVEPLQCLDSCQFVHTDCPFSSPGSLYCGCIERTALGDFLLPLLIGNLRQPIAEPVRLEAPFLSKRAA